MSVSLANEPAVKKFPDRQRRRTRSLAPAEKSAPTNSRTTDCSLRAVKCLAGTGQDLVAIQTPESWNPRAGFVIMSRVEIHDGTKRGFFRLHKYSPAWNRLLGARSERAPRRTGCH